MYDIKDRDEERRFYEIVKEVAGSISYRFYVDSLKIHMMHHALNDMRASGSSDPDKLKEIAEGSFAITKANYLR